MNWTTLRSASANHLCLAEATMVVTFRIAYLRHATPLLSIQKYGLPYKECGQPNLKRWHTMRA